MHRFAAIFATAMLLTACGDQGPAIPQFKGAWSGQIQGVEMSLTATEDSQGRVSGSGTFHIPNDPLAFSVNGTHSHPSVSFTGSGTGMTDFNFSGDFTDDQTVHGALSGSGFNGEAIVLRRQ